MRTQVKLGLYVVTVLGTLLFGSLFLRTWRAAEAGPAASATAPRKPSSPTAKQAATNAPTLAGTNAQAATGTVTATNAVTGATPPATTNAPDTEVAPPSEAGVREPTPEEEAVPTRTTLGPKSRGLGRMVIWGLLAVVSVVALGCLVAYDVSQYAAHRATRVLFNDDPGELEESAYEVIEKVHTGGDFLEAVRLLRDFLKENPRAAHAQIRIAEIYEKDLNNPLAAALEYEEVLKLRLEPERRGWTCIHLVNLYNRMDKPERAVAMLQRIVVECPDTPAATKARERLATAGIEIPDPATQAPDRPPEDDGSSPGLPKGFRRK